MCPEWFLAGVRHATGPQKQVTDICGDQGRRRRALKALAGKKLAHQHLLVLALELAPPHLVLHAFEGVWRLAPANGNGIMVLGDSTIAIHWPNKQHISTGISDRGRVGGLDNLNDVGFGHEKVAQDLVASVKGSQCLVRLDGAVRCGSGRNLNINFPVLSKLPRQA